VKKIIQELKDNLDGIYEAIEDEDLEAIESLTINAGACAFELEQELKQKQTLPEIKQTMEPTKKDKK